MTKEDLLAKPFHRVNVRHLKSGNIYTLLGMGFYEPDESEVAIYQASPLLGGKIWVRPLAEFLGGRFEIHSERIPTERLGLPMTDWREGGKFDLTNSPVSDRPIELEDIGADKDLEPRIDRTSLAVMKMTPVSTLDSHRPVMFGGLEDEIDRVSDHD